MNDFKIPFRVGAFSGRYSSGKTLACAELLVMANRAGVPREELLYLDPEGGVRLYSMEEPYKGAFTVKDLTDPDEFPKYWNGLITGTQKYQVVVIDPEEIFQDMWVDMTWNDKSLSDAYKEKNTPFMWGRVKKAMAKDLIRLMGRTRVLIMTSHARREFVGGRATGRFEGKFLDPIWNLCDFVAFLEREPNKRLPHAFFGPPLGKSRILGLPPRIEEFTWPKMFQYIGEKPKDWGNLKKEEMMTQGLELLDKIEKIASAGPAAEEGE